MAEKDPLPVELENHKSPNYSPTNGVSISTPLDVSQWRS